MTNLLVAYKHDGINYDVISNLPRPKNILDINHQLRYNYIVNYLLYQVI